MLTLKRDRENVAWLAAHARRGSVGSDYGDEAVATDIPRLLPVASAEGTEVLIAAITGGQRQEVLVILRDLRVEPNARDATTGTLPLHVAAARGDVAILRDLVRYRARLNVVDEPGRRTALHVAARSGNVASRADAVKLLLDHGADPNAEDSSGHTALWYAASHADDLNVLRSLMMARPLADMSPHNGSSIGNNSPGPSGTVATMADASVIDHRCHDPRQPTALWAATMSDGPKALASVQALLAAGASPDAARVGPKNRTLLHRATAVLSPQRAAAIVPCLLDAGADARARDAADELPLHRAARAAGKAVTPAEARDRCAVVDALLKCKRIATAPVEDGIGARDFNGATPFLRAAQAGSLPVVRRLAAAWAERGKWTRVGGPVPDTASAATSSSCRGGWAVPDNEGNSPLYHACAGGHLLTVSYLLGMGADIDEAN